MLVIYWGVHKHIYKDLLLFYFVAISKKKEQKETEISKSVMKMINLPPKNSGVEEEAKYIGGN